MYAAVKLRHWGLDAGECLIFRALLLDKIQVNLHFSSNGNLELTNHYCFCGKKNVYLMQVILTDGDLSTLANLRSNLELNQLSNETDLSERIVEDLDVVSFISLFVVLAFSSLLI